MPGVTDTQSLRFGYVTDPISHTTVRDLADDVAAQYDAADVARAAALQKPVVRVQRNAGLAIPVTTITAIPWDVETTDTHGMVDIATNPTRVTAVTAAGSGLYLAEIDVQSNMGSWTRADIILRRNGTFYAQKSWYNPQDFNHLQFSSFIDLDTVGFYLEWLLYHEGGGTTNTVIVEGRVFKATN
jgi:hypothetical protein